MIICSQMNVKIIRIVLLSFIFFAYANVSSFASDKDEIREYAVEYFKLLQEKKYSECFDNIYPLLFDFVSKDFFVEAMEKMDNDSNINISFSGFRLGEVSDIVTYENIKYAVVEYTFDMVMKVEYDEDDKEQKALTVEFTLSALKGQFGEDNVIFDNEKSAYLITPDSRMFAIQDPAYAGWKFLEDKENIQSILEQILPERVLEELGTKKSETKE